MAGTGIRSITEAIRRLSFPSKSSSRSPRSPTCLPTGRRLMATEAHWPDTTRSVTQRRVNPFEIDVPVTIYDFPSLEPRAVEAWSCRHLLLPLRRDILHLAVVYEGDKTRQGTASSKTRWDVRGSHRKMFPQKGRGRARRGSRQSPLLRGGGKSHGPHPRDFSTSLNRKVYDLAWRTALSYRYRRGELIVTEDGLELPLPEAFLDATRTKRLPPVLQNGFLSTYVGKLMAELGWGIDDGRTTFITTDRRKNLWSAFDVAGEHGRALELDDVDVKDLLETGRIVMEKSALRYMITQHKSDLESRIVVHGKPFQGPSLGRVLVG